MEHARDHAEQRRDEPEHEQSRPVRSDPNPDRALVDGTVGFLHQAGRDDERRAEEREQRQPGTAAVKEIEEVSGQPRRRAKACHPPAAAIASGTAMAKPTSFTTSCTRFTQAELSNPPATKYTVITAPPTTAPTHRGCPATTSRMVAMPIN